MTIKRQFIAGAVCSSCGGVDKIQRCIENDVIWMECVACGMVRNLDEEAPEHEEEHDDGGVQVVRLQPAGNRRDES